MSNIARLTRRQRLAFIAFCAVGVPLLTLSLLEGAGSTLLFFHEAAFGTDHRVADHRYTRYDPELGWIPRANADLPNIYGKGIGVQINAQGFRGQDPIARQVSPGRRRLICSGDSFTFGYGVSNADTWCSRLEALDPTWEAINMAVVGYGIDQMYMRFLRDATPFDHQVHLIAFIEHDFKRMGSVPVLGADKPRLAIRNGELSIVNRPVPKRWFTPGWWLRGARAGSELRIAELFSRLGPEPPANASAVEDSLIWETAMLAFEDLRQRSAKSGGELVLVYLPSHPDFDLRSRVWRQAVTEFTAARQIPYLDLATEFLQLPADSMHTFFRPVDRHYTPGGHAWVAERVQAFLDTLPTPSALERASLEHSVHRGSKGGASRLRRPPDARPRLCRPSSSRVALRWR